MWKDLENFAGGHVRAVWLADAGDGTDVFAVGDKLLLMGLDSRDGRNERQILPEPGGYFKPLLTPGGDKVVFTDTSRGMIRVVDFDGKNAKDLTPGMALATWRDPADGIDWVFVRKGDIKSNDGPVVKVQFVHPEKSVEVWNFTPVDADNFQVSADGKWAGGVFPWPQCAEITCGTQFIVWLAKGCWTSFSPDNSRILWCLDGEHRSIILYDCKPIPAWQGGRKILLGDAPGINGGEIYHPRWTNNPPFMVMTGPYDQAGAAQNKKIGSRAVEVYLGRFDRGLTGIEKWFRLTSNDVADYYPDAWIGGPAQPLAIRPMATQPAATAPVGGN